MLPLTQIAPSGTWCKHKNRESWLPGPAGLKPECISWVCKLRSFQEKQKLNRSGVTYLKEKGKQYFEGAIAQIFKLLRECLSFSV